MKHQYCQLSEKKVLRNTINRVELRRKIIMKKIIKLPALATLLFSCAANAQEKPNIVIILADDMGYRDVAFNNPNSRTVTPAIDKLASNGISFSDAHSGGAVSTPSRYGLLTGRYFFRAENPKAHWGYLPPLIEPERETIGSLMQRAGYTTACIGKWHLGLHWQKKNANLPLIPEPGKLGYTNVDFTKKITGGPSVLGFDYSYIMPASLDMPPYLFVKNEMAVDSQIILTADVYPNVLEDTQFAWDRIHTSNSDVYWERGVWWRNGEMSKSFKVEDCMDDIANEGIAFIEREGKKKEPFLLYLPLTGPHTPWMPNEEFKGTTKLGTYGDFIAQIDNIVERVSAKIEELGISENTIIIFSSDNGGAWQEEDILQYAHSSNYGRRGQKGDAWDGGHHIPLFVTWPAQIKKPKEFSHTVSLVDLIATFSDIVNEPIRASYGEDSFSFISVLEGNIDTPTRENIIYISSSGKLAIKKNEWKYIEGIGSGGFTAPGKLPLVKNGPKGQLYNMKTDSLERNNRYLAEPEKVKELTNLLKDLKDRGRSN